MKQRVDTVERLVRQAGECKSGLRSMPCSRSSDARYVLAQSDVVRSAKDRDDRSRHGGREHDADDRDRPEPRGREDDPGKPQEADQRKRRNAASQIVEYLPAGEHRERITLKAFAGVRHHRKYPARDLPVAARPAMAACCIGAVSRGMFLVELDIAQETRPGVAALEQIVAEDAVFRQPAGERLFERIDVVNALADER